MPPDGIRLSASPAGAQTGAWAPALARLALASFVIFALTLAEWREMAHQWWDIDTYAHILLIPPILAWLVWLRRTEIRQIVPVGWGPGLGIVIAGLAIWFAGRAGGINLFAQTGAMVALQGTVAALLGVRTALILAFPLLYALFLVPFGDEIIPALQDVTARIAVALTHASGVPATIDGLFIDTPAGRFVVAEECSGVKFLIAMIALGTLVAWTGFRSWERRALLLAGAAFTSIAANGVRAWGTIFAAQYVGAERAGSFDHIVYGWVFFAIVIALVLGFAWRFFEREPGEAGLTALEADALARSIGGRDITGAAALLAIGGLAIAFAVLDRVV
jgi:exosortase A